MSRSQLPTLVLLACSLPCAVSHAQLVVDDSGLPTEGSYTENVDFGDVDGDGDWDVAIADGGDAGLAGCQVQADRAAFGIHEGVDLRGQPAAGMSHAAMLIAPLFVAAPCWRTRTHELSIMTMSPS